MASHESDMHRRLRHALGEIERLEQENAQLRRQLDLLLFRAPPAGQFEVGAALRDRRGRSHEKD